MAEGSDCSPALGAEGTVVYSEIPIEWPRKVVIVDADADDSGSESNPVPRPDSGVGESVSTATYFRRSHLTLLCPQAECLNDAGALGELCHTKGSLRLPLVNAPAVPTTTTTTSSPKEDSDEELRKESSDDHMGLPTPSCTGSMDSLSSSSCSDRQMPTFTAAAFGKETSPQSSQDETRRLLLSSCALEATDVQFPVSQEDEQATVESGTCKRISDSTDEDSGIENISRRIN